MSQIIVENLSKRFQVAERQPGFVGAVRGLFSRRYRSVDALRDVNFTIDSGELVGYIGPNGAGKSTTIKVLSGILVPSDGRCEVNGITPWLNRQQHVANIGVVFGQRTQLWWDLPVIESFELLRDIYKVPAHIYAQSRDELIEIMGIHDLLDTPVRQLSLGQRMRCDLVASLLHHPAILFLDEPTIGLDAVSKLAVREFVRKLNKEQGVTVILTTHDMDDIEALCERVIVIGNGTILNDGSLTALRNRINPERRLKIELATEQVFDIAQAEVIAKEGAIVHVSYNPQEVTTTKLIQRITESYQVKDLFVENPPIEELIAQLYQNEGNGN